MKTGKWHSRIVISLLMVLVLMFSILAVTASATSTVPDDVSDGISYDEPWYRVEYIPATDSAKARIDIRIKTDWASYGDITKEDLAAIEDRFLEIAYQLVFDTVMAEDDSETADADSGLSTVLLSTELGGGMTLPDDLEHIDINRLEQFIKDHFGAADETEIDDAKEKIDNYLAGDYDTIISIGVDKYAPDHTLEEIKEKAEHIFQTVIESVYKDDSTAAAEKIQASSEKMEEIVKEVEEIYESGEKFTIEIKDVIPSLNSVSLDGTYVYDGGKFILEGLKEILRNLPKMNEIADFEDDEMLLEYAVESDFIFGEVDFDLSIGFEGDCSEIRAVAGIIADYVSFEELSDGTVSVSVDVPRKFSDAIVKALDKDTVSDELKHKIFSLMSKDANDIYAYIKDLSFDEVIELLEAVDFESILDKEAIKQHIDLSHLSNQEIVDKIAQYEGYYNKALSLVTKVMNKLPESIKSKTLFDVYDGNGSFAVSIDKQGVDVEKILESVGGRYGSLISAFLDQTTIDVKAEFSLNFAAVNRVTYMLDRSTVLSDGFLPAGADVVFFANKTQHGGRRITAWVDSEGVAYTEMPDEDIVLYAYFGSSLSLTYNDTLTKVYNGEISYIELDAVYTPSALGASYSVTYKWYKGSVADENLIENASADAFGVRNVNESGTYICVVTVDEAGFITSETATFTVTITKKQINVSAASWNYDASSPFFYNGEAQRVSLNGLPAGVEVTYENNEFTDAGVYTASATFESADADNTEIVGTVPNLEWEIKKATYDISGLLFEDLIVEYDGKPHGIKIQGTLPTGLKVTYTPEVSAVGTYTMKATFVVDKNHNELEPLTATLIILPREIAGIEFSYTVDGEIVVEIISKDPLGEGVTVTLEDLTEDYANIDLSAIADGKSLTLGVAYDISFLKDGAAFEAKDGRFTVKLLIPEALRAKSNLKVIHIADDGAITLMDSERDGDYMVFDTEHFSVYSIIFEDESELNLWWLWVLIAVVAALAVAVVVLLIIKRRKAKPENPDDNTPEHTPAPENNDEAPIEETPAEEAPVEEAPAEEAPTEEAPAEEAPAEEAPAEEAPAEEPAPAIVIADDDSIVVDGNVVYIRYRSSFTSRLIQAEELIQDYYTKIKNYILSFKGVKARTSFNYEAFNKGRAQCVRLNVKGKALLLNLALEPAEYSVSKYHFVDMSDDSKVAGVPMLLKVKSERSLKYAFELIDEVMKKLGIEQGEIPEVDYRMPYEPNSQLAKRGLVKVILPAGVKLDKNAVLREADVGELLSGAAPAEKTEEVAIVPEEAPVEEAPVEEAPVEEAPVEEAPAEEAPAEEKAEAKLPIITADDSILVNGEAVSVRYRSSFTSRLIQAEESVQNYYTVIKNYLLSFKGVKARTSWNYENFGKGRTQCARINVKGKTLTVNLALAPEAYNVNKYHFTDVSDDPKFDKLPMLLKVRSARALKYALELISELMASLNIAQSAVPEVDYRMPYEHNRELAKRGLVKLILPKGVKLSDAAALVETNVSDLFGAKAEASEPEPEHVIHIVNHHIAEEEIVHVDAEHADLMISDELAQEFIETIHHSEDDKPTTSKCDEINLDTICQNYDDGDTVTLKSLKEKGLVSPKAERIKVLARGVMTKKLTVYADKFSMQAVKMIGLAGGVAELYED